MRYIISFAVLFLMGTFSLCAQIITLPTEDSTLVRQDTLLVKPPVVDSTLLNVPIFQFIMGKTNPWDGNIIINQPSYMSDAFYHYVSDNTRKKRNGYRIRIFFDNKQSARNESENIVKTFAGHFPLVPAYRSYSTPYFKVVVGDYRTKSDAIKALDAIKYQYPKALVVKEQIGFPQL